MTSERERRIHATFIHLLELFQRDGKDLSPDTQEGIVQILESLRWDAERLLPGSDVWNDLEDRLLGLSRRDRRRFEHLVREMLLRQASPPPP